MKRHNVKFSVKRDRLMSGETKSCGCLKFERERSLGGFVTKRNTLGIAGIEWRDSFRGMPQGWYADVALSENNKIKERVNLYFGPDFFEACCARKSYEANRLRIKNFI